MTTDDKTQKLTRLLRAASTGEDGAWNEVLALVHEELRAVARRRLQRERPDHTLQPTDLVHEAYLRLVGPGAVGPSNGEGGPAGTGAKPEGGPRWSSRGAFFHAAAEAMRRILIDHARARRTRKRGGSARRELVDLADLAARQDPEEIIALDEAIGRLEKWDPRVAGMVRLRFYAGLSVDETAEAMGISPRTVRRDWGFARAWLFRALSGKP